MGTLVLRAATLLALAAAGCSSQPTFIAADHQKCRELGFHPGSADYATCLSSVQRQRTNLAGLPEPLRD
jgi:hypothetical protein